MRGFSELDLVGQFYRTWDRLLTTGCLILFTYVIFCSVAAAVVLHLRRSGSCKFFVRATTFGVGQIRRELARSIFSLTIFQIAMVASRVIAMGLGMFIDFRDPQPLWKIAPSFVLIFIA